MKNQGVPTDLSTVIVYNPSKNEYLIKSRAIIEVLAMLRRPWSYFYYPMKMMPQSISDRVYSFVGRNRYRIFGKRNNQEKECCKFE